MGLFTSSTDYTYPVLSSSYSKIGENLALIIILIILIIKFCIALFL